MEILGKLRQILPEQRGESARGPWVRGGFVIDINTDSQYPRSIAFSTWGEDILAQLKTLHIGATIQVIFDIESRQWEDRWFTDCRCRSIGTFVSNTNNNAYNTPGYQNMPPAQPQAQPQPPQAQAQPMQPDYQRPNNEMTNTYQAPVNETPASIENDSMDMEDSDDLPF